MRTLQLELEDGRTLEVEVDDGQPAQKEVVTQEKPKEPDFQPKRALTGYPELPRRSPMQDIAGFTEGFTGGIPRMAVQAGAKYGPIGLAKQAITGEPLNLDIPTGAPDAQRVGNVAGLATAGFGLAKMAKGAVNLGGNKAIRKIAIQANRDLIRARNQFSREYAQVLAPVSKNAIKPTEFKPVLDEAKQLVSKGTPAYKAISQFEGQIENMTVKQLHALKGRLFKQAKSMPGNERDAVMRLYGKTNEYLEKVVGKGYSDLNANFRNFMTNEANYVQKKILDSAKNVTESKLAKRGLLGVGLPGAMDANTKKAFQLLSKRKTSLTDVIKELNKVKRGEIAKGAGLAVASALLAKHVRSIPGEFRGLVERSID